MNLPALFLLSLSLISNFITLPSIPARALPNLDFKLCLSLASSGLFNNLISSGVKSFKDLPFRCLSDGYTKHADQKFVISVESDRDKFMFHLLKHKIETRIHYKEPLSELKSAKFFCKTLDFMSVSAMLSRSVLSLPIYPELLDSEVEYIASMVKAFYDK